MRIIDSVTLPGGHRLLIVETSSSGGGAWTQPVRLALVETDGTPYRHARARNVLRTLAVAKPDGRHQGPRSGYGRVLAEMRETMAAAAADYRPGGDVPGGALEVTSADLEAAAIAAAGKGGAA